MKSKPVHTYSKKLIKDKFTKLNGTVSRQRIWQIRRSASGRCENCGKSHPDKRRLCALCMQKQIALQKIWVLKNPDKVKKYMKSWRMKNPGYMKKYYAENIKKK